MVSFHDPTELLQLVQQAETDGMLGLVEAQQCHGRASLGGDADRNLVVEGDMVPRILSAVQLEKKRLLRGKIGR